MVETAAKNKPGQRMKKQKRSVEVLKRLAANKTAMIGLAVFLFLIVIAIIAPYIIPYGYADMDLANMFSGPSREHWFGTDELGRDIFSRLLYGARFSMSIGIIVVAVSSAFGIFLGAVAGYFGGQLENIIMRMLDIIQALPGMLLNIAIAAVLGVGFDKTIICLSIGSIAGQTRLLRSTVLGVRENEYIEAATAINCSKWRIITRHVLPNAFSPLIVSMTMGVASAISSAASLSFIGLGVRPPEPEWGAMLAAGRTYIREYPHLAFFPGLVIMIVILALNMLGDGLRDALDPKLKK